MVMVFAKTSFVAMTDHQVILKNVPQLKLPPRAPRIQASKLSRASGRTRMEISPYLRAESETSNVPAVVRTTACDRD